MEMPFTRNAWGMQEARGAGGDRGMIIDAHAHCDIRFGWKHTSEVLIRMMDEGGIDKACISGLADVPGDDPPNHNANMELERIHAARIPETAKTKILGTNLLGIQP
jgi:hypothetical protein